MRFWLFSGSVLGGIGVTAGSFGAHGLASLLNANGQAHNWETSVRYCLFHAMVILVVAIACALPHSHRCRRNLHVAGWCFLLGTIVFSGFLGVLSLTNIKQLGAIVPVGGVLLIVGWICLAVSALRLQEDS